MGIILAKFRKEKSTQEVLEALQEKIEALEKFTFNTREQKKRVVGNFLAISIGLYIVAFAVFYFLCFPPTWHERIIYFVPLFLFPFVIMLLRHLFTWYYQRKLNKNSKKLTALRADKKKILEQVMDKETYKVAVNLLARFADKPSSSSHTTYSAMASNLNTPLKSNQASLNRSLPASSTLVKATTMSLTPNIPTVRSDNISAASNLTPLIAGSAANTPRTALTALATPGSNQVVRRRTPFPVVNQQNKGVFEKIVDVLIGDGPGDRFAMICKECYAHNGMALKEDFEYTTFRCAFCNALNHARKSRPAAPRLSHMPIQRPADSSSDEKDESDDELSPIISETQQFVTPPMTQTTTRTRDDNTTSSSSSCDDDYQQRPPVVTNPFDDESNEECRDSEIKADKLPQKKTANVEKSDKSDSAIDDVTMSPEEH